MHARRHILRKNDIRGTIQKDDDGRAEIDYQYNGDELVQIPEGYHRFRRYDDWLTGNVTDSTVWRVTIDDTLCVAIDIDHLPMGEDKEQDWLLQDLNRPGVHYVYRLSLHEHISRTLHEQRNDSVMVTLSIAGYYFEK